MQGLNAPNLKRLYALLHHLSTLKTPISGSPLDMKFEKCGLNFKLKDIICLSDILFKQLEARFHGFFSALHELNVSAADNGKCFLIEELTLLLRCCLVMLVLMEYDQPLLVQKGLGILNLLSRLVTTELSGRNGKSSITFKKLISRQSVSDDCTTSITEEFVASLCLWKPSDPRYAYLCAVLEVDPFVFASLFFSLVIFVFLWVMIYLVLNLQEYCVIEVHKLWLGGLIKK